MRLTIECGDANKRFTGALAVPSTILTIMPETESSAKYNADYNADYNTEYNAISVSNVNHREYYPEYDNDSDWATPSYTTTMSIDDCKSTSQWSPSNRCSLRRYMTSRRRSNDFQARGMNIPESQTTPTADNYPPGSAGTKSTDSSDGKHMYRSID